MSPSRLALTSLTEKLKKVQVVVFDFYGVITDGFVYMFEDGKEVVRFSQRDNLGILMLKELGVKIVVISKDRNPVVGQYCGRAGIECFQAVDDKVSLLKVYLSNGKNISSEEVVFVGDDINDLEAMRFVGVPITMSNGDYELTKVANYVTIHKGGDGAVREICDLVILAKKEGSANA